MSAYFRRPDPAPATSPSAAEEQPPSDQPAPFDFRKEMRETRLEAERLLELRTVEEAEAYMEERRQFFVQHGYRIRKLNQAYFAFHGSYADTPGSINPIGPQLEQLLEKAGSVQRFLQTLSGISNGAEYRQLLEREGVIAP
jgi:hypothetical protein